MKSFARCAKKYVVDIDPYLLERKYQEVPFDVNIRSDLKIFFKIFNEELDKNKQISLIYKKKKWLNTVINWKNKYDPVDEIVKNREKHKFKKKS